MKVWMLEHVSESITEQLCLIGVSLLAGMFLCLVYDLFRGCRRVQHLRRRCECQKASETKWMASPKGENHQKSLNHMEESIGTRFMISLEDILFCIIYVVVTYIVLYFYHNGTISGYVFLGEVLGAVFYYKLFHNWIRCVFTCVLWQICTITGWILQVIFLPFRVICGNLIKLLKSFIKSVKMVIINN